MRPLLNASRCPFLPLNSTDVMTSQTTRFRRIRDFLLEGSFYPNRFVLTVIGFLILYPRKPGAAPAIALSSLLMAVEFAFKPLKYVESIRETRLRQGFGRRYRTNAATTQQQYHCVSRSNRLDFLCEPSVLGHVRAMFPGYMRCSGYTSDKFTLLGSTHVYKHSLSFPKQSPGFGRI